MNTAQSAFNQWLNAQVRLPAGGLDLERLHEIARQYGIDRKDRYAALNPGQQRMSIGNLLRKAVPPEVYAADLHQAKTSSPGINKSIGKATLVREASVPQLLALHGQILSELRDRGVTRTANNPGGDYAELLFSKALGWSLAANSAAGHDAVDSDGIRYQIKSRRLSATNGSRQLGHLRGLPDRHFDYLAGVLFDPDYRVLRAALVPHELIEPRCRYSDHVKAWIFRLEDAVWALPGVIDVTLQLAAKADEM